MTGEPYMTPAKWRTVVRKQAPRRLKPFLLLLGERAQRDGTVRHATRIWLAEQFDVDPRTIQRWVKESTAGGWIVVAHRGQKHVSAQVYGLTVPVSQGDIRSCSQGDIPMLPENRFSGRQAVSPIYRETERSEGVAVHVDASGENTTAALASDPPLRRTAAAHSRPARRVYRCVARLRPNKRVPYTTTTTASRLTPTQRDQPLPGDVRRTTKKARSTTNMTAAHTVGIVSSGRRMRIAGYYPGRAVCTRPTGSRFGSTGVKDWRLAKQRLPHDLAVEAFAGFRRDESVGSLTGGADPDDEFSGWVLQLYDDEHFEHGRRCTRVGNVYRSGGESSVAFVEGGVAQVAFAAGFDVDGWPLDFAECDDGGPAERVGSGPVLHEHTGSDGVNFAGGLEDVADVVERPTPDDEVHAEHVKGQSGRSFTVSENCDRQWLIDRCSRNTVTSQLLAIA